MKGVKSKRWRQSGGAIKEGQMVKGLARSPLYPRHFAHAQREFRLWRLSALLSHMDGGRSLMKQSKADYCELRSLFHTDEHVRGCFGGISGGEVLCC